MVYNNMGHAIFTEDGVEQNNVVQYNLAVFTRTSSSLLNVDVTPASFWVRREELAGGVESRQAKAVQCSRALLLGGIRDCV